MVLALLGPVGVSACSKKEDDEFEPVEFGDGDETEPEKKSRGKAKPDPQPQPGPDPSPAPAPSKPVTNDPINRYDQGYLRARAQAVLKRLVAALSEPQRSQMRPIPLGFDGRPGEVNAFAACVKGRAFMVMTDGLMEIQAQMARAQAHDERFGTGKLDAYAAFVAKGQRKGRAVPRPPPSFYDAAKDQDGRKVARQRHLLDEGLAFVLGHELAHHYLSHTGCVGTDATALTPADVARAVTIKVPAFNQANELASDLYGIQNVLAAGRSEQPAWREDGALLTLRFFLEVRRVHGGDVLFSFQSTHPHPNVRRPVVTQAAETWRRTGGQALPVLKLPKLR